MCARSESVIWFVSGIRLDRGQSQIYFRKVPFPSHLRNSFWVAIQYKYHGKSNDLEWNINYHLGDTITSEMCPA